MRRTIASVFVFILVVSLLLTSCGKRRTFEPSGVTGEKAETAKSQRGEIKLESDKFTFYGVQMGMTTDQVQISVGKAAQVYARNDKMFLTEDVKVNEFKNGLDRVVYYIFNTNNQLVEVQYVVSSSDGVSYQNAVTIFRGIYGPDGIEIQSEIGKRETIWEYMDVYVIVARNDEKDVVISYMQKGLFETENKKDVENTTKQSRGGNKMAARKGGLGKGFEALMQSNTMDDELGEKATLSINDIEPNRGQPRKTFSEESLSELADSIREHGVLQPLLVRPMPDGSYRLVAGERRFRAARLAGLYEVPVTVREMTDEEESVFALIENLQREDLNAVEEAEGIKTLIDTFGFTQEQAAQKLGKSRTAVTNSLRLLNLPDSVGSLLKDGKISMGHARALLAVEDEAEMKSIADTIVKNGISVRETERLAKKAGNGGTAAVKRKKKRDTFYDEVELALAGVLARRVKVYNGKGSGGSIEIEFFGKDDLKKLAEQLEALE